MLLHSVPDSLGRSLSTAQAEGRAGVGVVWGCRVILLWCDDVVSSGACPVMDSSVFFFFFCPQRLEIGFSELRTGELDSFIFS